MALTKLSVLARLPVFRHVSVECLPTVRMKGVTR
jgi:hypothetical protein